MSWNVILKYCFFSVFTFQIDHIYTVYFVMSTFLNPFEYQIKSLRCFYYEEMIIFLFLLLSTPPLHLDWQMWAMCHRVLTFNHAQMPIWTTTNDIKSWLGRNRLINSDCGGRRKQCHHGRCRLSPVTLHWSDH